MATISASAVKDLREKTGVGMMEAKKALEEAGGDFEKAVDILRKKGLSAAAKKAERVAAEGMIASSIQKNGKAGTLIEVNSETDFVAKNEEFQKFVRGLAEIVAGKNPADVAALGPIDPQIGLLRVDTLEGKPLALVYNFACHAYCGAPGGGITIQYTFSTTTTDADPGNGNLRLSNATQNAATTIRTDLLDSGGMDWTSVLDTLDAARRAWPGRRRDGNSTRHEAGFHTAR